MRILIPLLLLSVSGFAQQYPKGIEHVIVIGVDGLSPNGIRKANTPTLDKMIKGGSVKWNVRTVLPSSSSSNWASMIMGAGVEQHGITSNDWQKDDHSLPAIVRNEDDLFPTIFSVLHKQYPTAKIGTAFHWSDFGRLVESSAVTYKKHFSTEDSTTKAFTEYIESEKPLFAFLHLDHVDHAGHEYGHGTDHYFESVTKADSLIGEVLRSLKKSGLDKSTLVIVTADHGGIGYGHGGATLEEAEIAMILYGKDVKVNYEIPEQAATYDLAATIAFALRTTPPYVWIGRPLKSAFTGFAAPANLWAGKSILPKPVINPDRKLYEQAGGLFVNKPAEVSMDAVTTNAGIYYTIDGTEPSKSAAVYKAPFIVNGNTVVKAKTIDSKGNESPVNTAYFRVVDSNGRQGLTAAYYEGADWKYLPVFKELKPVSEWTSLEVNLAPARISAVRKGESSFGVVFNGFIQIDTEGEYKFFTSSDDGSKLYIDGKVVVDNDGDHGVIERSGSVNLSKGKHAIVIEYFNGGGGYWIDAFY
ncbi:MAG: beta-glucosidase, partial [Chitinophagaceae bacterium]